MRVSASKRVTRSRADNACAATSPATPLPMTATERPCACIRSTLGIRSRAGCGWELWSGGQPRPGGRGETPHQFGRRRAQAVFAGRPAAGADAPYPRCQLELGTPAAGPVDRVVGVQAPELTGDRVKVRNDLVAGKV